MSTATPAPVLTPISSSVSEIEEPFVGQWNRLISTTNWEKGRIVQEWREALILAEAPSVDYSDENWCRRVGGVTSQHVGRLRRVFQRFSQTYERFHGLYWSHFQAALDWDDAEMWLEGAVQSGWSVAAMRQKRWETLGRLPADDPAEQDGISVELDEDFVPPEHDQLSTSNDRPHFDDGPPVPEGPDFGDAAEAAGRVGDHPAFKDVAASGEVVQTVRPFENLAPLPADLAEAFDAFKIALLRHKAEGWQQISCADVLASLDALKELSLAPSAAAAPF